MSITEDRASLYSTEGPGFTYQPSASLDQAEERLNEILERIHASEWRIHGEFDELENYVEQMGRLRHDAAIRDVFSASDLEYNNAVSDGCSHSTAACRVWDMVRSAFPPPAVQPTMSIPIAYFQGIHKAREAVESWARSVVTI